MSDANSGNGAPATVNEDPSVAAAKAEKSKRFYDQLDVETRALRDPNLSHGAARLFLLIVKLSWKPEFGGQYNGRTGSLAMAGPELAAHFHANVNSFYEKRKKEKRDAAGNLIQSATVTPGWIERLVSCGYLWISKHKIPNIPEDKWLNVYNVTSLVPKQAGSGPTWFQGSWGSNTHAGGSRFLAKNGSGDGQTTESGPPTPPQVDVPTPRDNVSQPPASVSPNPPQADLATPRKSVGQPPASVSAHPPQVDLASSGKSVGPSPGSGYKKKSGDPIPVSKSFRRGTRPPSSEVEPAKLDEWAEWMREVKREFRKERKDRLDLLKKDVAKLKANPKNWKIALVPAAAKAIADREAVIAELRGKKPVPEKRIAELQVQIEEVRQDAASGTPTSLLPGPAATQANYTRKITALEGLLR